MEQNTLAYELVKELVSVNKRGVYIIIALIIALALSNLAWLYVFNSYDYSSSEVLIEANDGGDAHYLEKGDINYGKDQSQEESKN